MSPDPQALRRPAGPYLSKLQADITAWSEPEQTQILNGDRLRCHLVSLQGTPQGSPAPPFAPPGPQCDARLWALGGAGHLGSHLLGSLLQVGRSLAASTTPPKPACHGHPRPATLSQVAVGAGPDPQVPPLTSGAPGCSVTLMAPDPERPPDVVPLCHYQSFKTQPMPPPYGRSRSHPVRCVWLLGAPLW